MREDQRSIAAPPSGEAAAHLQGGTQGHNAVGEVERGIGDNAVDNVAHPRTVTVQSAMYSVQDAEQISRLRQERWCLLAHFADKAAPYFSRTTEYSKLRTQLEKVNAQLYTLTQNPIYHVVQ